MLGNNSAAARDIVLNLVERDGSHLAPQRRTKHYILPREAFSQVTLLNGYCTSSPASAAISYEEKLDPYLILTSLWSSKSRSVTTMQVVSTQKNVEARQRLPEKEKELTQARDAVNKDRQALPIVRVTKKYFFTSLDPLGNKVERTLQDLFDDRSRLIV